MKNLGPLTYFLGIHASRNQNGLHLQQSKYISDFFHHSHMVGAKPYSSPSVTGSKMSKFDGEPLPDPTPYRHIIGALQYCKITRPDIAYSVNHLCQFLHSPKSIHFTAAKHVLRYLKPTIDYGISFTKG